MSFSEHKITGYEIGVSDLPDYPSDEGYTASQIKALFDARSDNEIKKKHNALVDEVDCEIGGLKERVEPLEAGMSCHIERRDNPHEVTAEQMGLGNVDNTSDANKPISYATRLALDEKADELRISTGIKKTHSLPDSRAKLPVSLKIHGESTQDGTPTPEAPISVASAVNPVLTISTGADDAQPQSVTIPYTLRGLKGSDENWVVRDEIVVLDNSVKFIKRIHEEIIVSPETLTLHSVSTSGQCRIRNLLNIPHITSQSNPFVDALMSPQFKNVFTGANYRMSLGYSGNYANHLILKLNPTNDLGLTTEDTDATRIQKFKDWVAAYNASHDIPLTFYYPMSEPTETDITDTEAGQALLELYMNYPSTTVLCDADCELTYKADTTYAYKALLERIEAIENA